MILLQTMEISQTNLITDYYTATTATLTETCLKRKDLQKIYVPSYLSHYFEKSHGNRMSDGITTRINSEIPSTQAAERKGRSTTEQKFTVMKTLTE